MRWKTDLSPWHLFKILLSKKFHTIESGAVTPIIFGGIIILLFFGDGILYEFLHIKLVMKDNANALFE